MAIQTHPAASMPETHWSRSGFSTAAVRLARRTSYSPRARTPVEVALHRLLRSARNRRLPALLSREIDVQVLPIRREVVGIEARNPRLHESIVDLGYMWDQRHVDLCQLRHLPREYRLPSEIGLAQHLLIQLVIFARARHDSEETRGEAQDRHGKEGRPTQVHVCQVRGDEKLGQGQDSGLGGRRRGNQGRQEASEESRKKGSEEKQRLTCRAAWALTQQVTAWVSPRR
jgi:hypothetical protein